MIFMGQIFGFHTAVDTGTEAIDRLHTTAASHSRILLAKSWVIKLAG